MSNYPTIQKQLGPLPTTNKLTRVSPLKQTQTPVIRCTPKKLHNSNKDTAGTQCNDQLK